MFDNSLIFRWTYDTFCGILCVTKTGGAKMKRIIRNAIQCNNCGDIIESQYRHDYVQCKCGDCAVDGGHDYLRRCYMRGGKGFKDLSEVIDRQPNGANGGSDDNN